MQKAMYGTIQSSLFFYNRITEDIKKIGLKVNPYDP
jgi:hypothetical protein